MLLAVAVALAGGATVGVRARWVRREVARAQAEIAAGRIGPARHRLAALATAHPARLGGTVDYLLGTCEAIAGRDEAALSAFARVPDGFEFASAGAYLEARANLGRGRLRAAETRLEATLKRGGPNWTGSSPC